MFPLDVGQHDNVSLPPVKRSCAIPEVASSFRDNGNFFPCGNDLYDRSFPGTEDLNTAVSNLGQNCFPSDIRVQPMCPQLATPFIGDPPATCFGMPYVFPVQSAIPKCASCSSPESGVSNGESEEKNSSVDVDKSSMIKDISNGTIMPVSRRDLYPQVVFCKVPSRTAVQKPKMLTVTVGEVYRRVFGPEMMNVSLLGSYLRRAKEKDGGKTLRDELTRLGMFVPLGRRKNGSTTTWTCFVEEEAQAMAVDLDVASRKFFPVQNFSETIKERLNCPDTDLRVIAMGVKRVLKVMRQIFLDDRSPVHGREEGGPILKKELQDGLYRFSCATHGFGSLALTSAIDLFDAFMESLLEDSGFSEDGSCSSSIDSI